MFPKREFTPASSTDHSPLLTPLQETTARATKYPPVPDNCVVTGGTGFIGTRLVEMLVERGAKSVKSLDIIPPPRNAWRHRRISYHVGDICDRDTVERVIAGADCVWHVAATVGGFHPPQLYFKVNYEGTLNGVLPEIVARTLNIP